MFLRVLLTAVVAVGLASAQRGGGGSGMGAGTGDEGGGGGMGAGGMGGSGMPGGMPRKQTKAEVFMDKLKLNKEQKDDTIAILMAAAEKALPIRDQLTKGRAMMANMITSKAPEAELKKLMTDYTSVAAMMTNIEAEAFGKIYALLKPNQQAKAPPAFELMAGMFAPPPAPGQGRGRGGQMGAGRGEGGRQ
ncbi:MAG: hypothetical protein ABI806_10815 [Candidatus Solibacter sp.]